MRCILPMVLIGHLERKDCPALVLCRPAYGEPNGKPTFVAIGDGTNAYYSHDAINWDVAVVPKSAEWKHVTYGEPNGQPTYVAVAKDSDEGWCWLYNVLS